MPLWTSNILEPWNWRCQFLEPWGPFGFKVPINWLLVVDSALNFQYIVQNWNLEGNSAWSFQLIGSLEPILLWTSNISSEIGTLRAFRLRGSNLLASWKQFGLKVPICWLLGADSALNFQYIVGNWNLEGNSAWRFQYIGSLKVVRSQGSNLLASWDWRCQFIGSLKTVRSQASNLLAPWDWRCQYIGSFHPIPPWTMALLPYIILPPPAGYAFTFLYRS